MEHNTLVQQIKPLGARVLVKRKESEKTSGGIYLPESAQEKPKQGHIVAVGPGKVNDEGTLIPLELKVGDQVYFSSYAGSEVKCNEEGYLIMSQDDILCVIES